MRRPKMTRRMGGGVNQLVDPKITWGKRTVVLATGVPLIIAYAAVSAVQIGCSQLVGHASVSVVVGGAAHLIVFRSRREHGVPPFVVDEMPPQTAEERAWYRKQYDADIADEREQALAFIRQLHERMEAA
jgi:hypothetical protein